jgi:ketosteroid isomerase-like protein
MTPMDALALAAGYFDAWSRRDPDGIAGCFAPDATFADPAGDLPASAVAAHAGQLFARFPSLSFALRGPLAESAGVVAGRWAMHLDDREIRGADFVTVADGRVTAVERHYDPTALQPENRGTVTRVVSGSRARPGAFGITWQEAPGAAGHRVVRAISDRILAELPDTPGFIGGIAATVGDRFLTVSAWERPNDPFALIRDGAHRMAAVQFFGPDLYSAGWTGVWVPERLHNLWVRCPACGKMADAARPTGACNCGAALPEAPAYW